MEARRLVLRACDPLVTRRAARVAAAYGLRVTLEEEAAAEGDAPAGLLAALESEGAVAAIARWRDRSADLAIVGYVSTPAPELWREAELAGADAVTSRGNADRVLRACLEDRLSGRRRARRLRLAPLADFAGRLGHVGRIEQTPVGPIALYQLGGRLWATADACPHAGASLWEGGLDGEVITCPRHGSQFRVTDGARVRGPADTGVRTFPVVIEAGEAFVELPE